jgi:hypothetical protein
MGLRHAHHEEISQIVYALKGPSHEMVRAFPDCKTRDTLPGLKNHFELIFRRFRVQSLEAIFIFFLIYTNFGTG